VPRQVRAVAAVLVPSEFSRRDLVETFDLDPTRVHVVPNRVVDRGPLPEDRRAAADAKLVAAGVRDPFVLYLGNLHPRKNVGRLVDAFIQLSGAVPDARLVIAGGQWWKGGDERARAARASRGSIVFLGRVDDDVRRRLLERATLLAYPSMFEGFGLPPLEAMAAGTPVVSSDATAIPEVCGDAALLVDPTDVDAIADAMGRVLQDEDLRRQLRERGRARAATFDAARTGAAAMRAFADALAVAT
jgi:glycosyltransferase involved in cell wall biosynthesis